MAEIITEVVTKYTLHVTEAELQSIEYALDRDGRHQSAELHGVVCLALDENKIPYLGKD